MEYYYYRLTLCLWICIILYNHNKCFGCLEKERIALLELKIELRKNSAYDRFSTWNDEEGNDCCTWERIECNNTSSTSQVIHLSLRSVFDYFRDIHYTLNASLFLPFEELQHLDLAVNFLINLEGLSSLSKLTKLQHLDLSGNDLIDLQDFTNLSNLEVLNLANNNLKSFLPFHDRKHTSKLKVLNLGYNDFSRGIPPSILTFDSLQALSMPHGNLNGPITGLCELKNLIDLDLSENKFEGTLPSCFNNLTSLRMVDLSDNQLYGKIPSSLLDMKSLEYISLSRNQFDGLHFTSTLNSLSYQLKLLDMSMCNLNLSTNELLKFLHNQYNLSYLDLSHNNIHGSFPSWLVENNTRLEVLVLRNNSLTAHIQLGHVVSLLSKFDVSGNNIQGKLRVDIGDALPSIYYLNLSRNSIEGTLPTSLGNLKNLSYLDLSKNGLEGRLPTSIGNTDTNYESLVVLDLSSNKLSGEIPESWSLMTRLDVLILSNNMLNGQIWGLLNFTNLFILRLSNNQFTGNLPTQHDTSSLMVFDISQNNMSGRIPSWIGNAGIMKTLIMGNNSFHGPIPLEFCVYYPSTLNQPGIEFLDISHNHLSGSIPSCLNLTYLKYMHLQGNNISGSIPKAILESSNLITLDLRHNKLSGSIPSWIGSLTELKVLLLKGNNLSGSVIHQLCQLRKITFLDLSHNSFSGSIPPCFSNIIFDNSRYDEHAFKNKGYVGTGIAYVPFQYTNLLHITSFDNNFNIIVAYSEEEEVEFMTKSRSGSYKGDILNFMSGIDLSCNQFTGHIPNNIGALTMIKALNFSHNQLTGSIPRTLSNLKQVESMDLSYNNLTGDIPSEITDLNFLGVFNVSYNNLSGEVPNRGQFGTFESSYMGNSFLCGPLLHKPCKKNTDSTTTVTLAGSSASSSGIDLTSLFASFGASYIMTLAGLVIVLYINPYWRHLWFNFIDACLSFMFPFWSKAIYKVDK